MEEGFICIATLDRFDELRRFLTSFRKHNNHPISILLAKDIADAHRIKTLCAFYSPFEFTCMLDIDMLVNAPLNDFFAPAKEGKIGVVREKGVGCINSGVLVFPTPMMKSFCELWNIHYERKLKKGFDGTHGTWDQDLLNVLIKKFPYVELSSNWNHILKDYTPEEELKIYDEVKIFHFLHAPDIDRTKYKSYQEFMKL